jgi:hypothetical protein
LSASPPAAARDACRRLPGSSTPARRTGAVQAGADLELIHPASSKPIGIRSIADAATMGRAIR